MLLLLLFFAPTAYGAELLEKIKIERSPNGAIEKVVLAKGNSPFSSEDLLNNFLRDIETTQALMTSPGFLNDNVDIKEWPKEHRTEAKKSLTLLKEHDLKQILENPEVKKVLKDVFESANLEIHNFRVLAVPEDSKYFAKNEMLLKLIRQFSGLMKTALGNSFGVSIALYLVQYSFDMIIERRNFYQNYLLYYLDTYGSEGLGVTEAEVQKIKSSIFESRIKWYQFWELIRAQKTWDEYGYNNHLDDVIAAEKRKNSRAGDLNTWGSQMGFGFNAGEKKSTSVVVNLINSQNVVSKKLSLAFDADHPRKILTLRLVYFVLQLGLRFAPVPAVSSVFDFFVNSLYVPQRQLEGALYGYYQDKNSTDLARIIADQTINPFIIAEEF